MSALRYTASTVRVSQEQLWAGQTPAATPVLLAGEALSCPRTSSGVPYTTTGLGMCLLQNRKGD